MTIPDYFRVILQHKYVLERKSTKEIESDEYVIPLSEGYVLDMKKGLCYNVRINVSIPAQHSLVEQLVQYVHETRFPYKTIKELKDNFYDSTPFGSGDAGDRLILLSQAELYSTSKYGQERWAFIEWVLNQTEELKC